MCGRICEHLLGIRLCSRPSHIGTNKISLACFTRRSDSLLLPQSEVSLFSAGAGNVCSVGWQGKDEGAEDIQGASQLTSGPELVIQDSCNAA